MIVNITPNIVEYMQKFFGGVKNFTESIHAPCIIVSLTRTQKDIPESYGRMRDRERESHNRRGLA